MIQLKNDLHIFIFNTVARILRVRVDTLEL